MITHVQSTRANAYVLK